VAGESAGILYLRFASVQEDKGAEGLGWKPGTALEGSGKKQSDLLRSELVTFLGFSIGKSEFCRVPPYVVLR